MKKTLSNILKSAGLAAALLLSPGVNGEPTNANHADWLNAVKRTNTVRQETPKKLGRLETEIFNQARDYKPNGLSQEFPSYKDAKQEDIIDGFFINAGYTTEAVLDIVNKLKYDWNTVDPAKIKEFIEEKARKITRNADFANYLKEKKFNGNIDCKWDSSIAAAIYLNLDKNAEVELVTGLFFDKKYALNGVGHQWIKVRNQIIDPAINIPTETDNYIPLIAVSIKRKDNEYLLTPKLYCLTPEMETRIEK
jgi:hypothetical protein